MLEEGDIECTGIGPIVFTDQEDRKFYLEYHTKDLSVKFGECVRIKLEDDGIEGADSFAFGQVTAIFTDSAQEVFIEVRWFLLPHEISQKHRQMYVLR